MPVPEYNAIKAPALQFFTDGKPHRISEVFEKLAPHFSLTEQEQNELLPSGRQRKWHNRANWACYDLYRAGLLDRPKKGLYVITEVGNKIAEKKPARIDRDFLMQFPTFAAFIKAAEEGRDSFHLPGIPGQLDEAIAAYQTPEEMMDAAYNEIQTDLEKQILDLVLKTDPFRFEQLVLDLLVAMGYGGSREEAATVTKKSNDEGIDGLINEDRLGLDCIYVQAKRWKAAVGRPEIQSFVGALAGRHAHKGILSPQALSPRTPSITRARSPSG